MEVAGIPLAGTLDYLLRQVEIMADCTPKRLGGQDTGFKGAEEPEQ